MARKSLRLTRYARANIINDEIIEIQPIINQVEVLIIALLNPCWSNALQHGLFEEKFTINIHQFNTLLYCCNVDHLAHARFSMHEKVFPSNCYGTDSKKLNIFLWSMNSLNKKLLFLTSI